MSNMGDELKRPTPVLSELAALVLTALQASESTPSVHSRANGVSMKLS